jgi:hypothetical protein
MRSYLIEKVAAAVYNTENTAVGIRHADHVAPSIRKSWQSLHYLYIQVSKIVSSHVFQLECSSIYCIYIRHVTCTMYIILNFDMD